MKHLFLLLAIPFMMGNADLEFTQHHSTEIFLEEVEGYKTESYLDGKNFAICFGNNFRINGSRVKENEKTTRRQCLKMLSTHLKFRTKPILNLIKVNLTPTQKTAVLSYAYRNGIRGTFKRGLVDAINSKDRRRIRNIFINQKGVLSRAKKEYELWNRI